MCAKYPHTAKRVLCKNYTHLTVATAFQSQTDFKSYDTATLEKSAVFYVTILF
jgi:hypothetical protein